MSVLSLSRLVVSVVPTACVIAACSSSSSSGQSSDSSGTGGAGGSTPFNNQTTATGGTKAADAAPPPPDGPLHCVGDPAEWKQLTDGPMTCDGGEECCVIMSPCRGEAQIVLAAHQKEAAAAWHYCTNQCNDCVARPIEVACISGSCLGRVVSKGPSEPPEPPDSPLRQDHCGTALEFSELAASSKTGLHFWSYGCGPQGDPNGPDSGPDSGP